MGKFGAVIDSAMDTSGITPNVGNMVKSYGLFVLIIHILACIWWLWKVVSQTDELTHAFLDDISWGDHIRNDITSTRGKLEAYIIAVYITAQTLTTVGYGDITPDNTSERVGYSMFFIINAIVWGNLLAEINTIHEAQNEQAKQRMEVLQETAKFLVDNDCPSQLRIQIIRWARFNEDNKSEAEHKKDMIRKLPSDLQKGLVFHLYAKEVSKVPIFSFLQMKDSGNTSMNKTTRDLASTANHAKFLGEVFSRLHYKMFMPDEVLVNFSDPADRLIFFIQSTVDVEFEHAVIERPMQTMKGTCYIGDMSLVNDPDWGNSTQFHFPPTDEPDELTEIKVIARGELVQCLELNASEFQELLKTSPQAQAAVLEFLENWQKQRDKVAKEGLSSRALKVVNNWERILIHIVSPLRGMKKDVGGPQLSIHNLKVLNLGHSKKNISDDIDSDDEEHEKTGAKTGDLTSRFQESHELWKDIAEALHVKVEKNNEFITSHTDSLKRIEQALNELSTFVHKGRSDGPLKQRDIDTSLFALLQEWNLDDEADRLASVARVYTLEDLDSMLLEDVEKFGLRLGFRKLIQARNTSLFLLPGQTPGATWAAQ